MLQIIMETLLILAADTCDRMGQESVEWLLTHGADVNVANQYGETALLIATFW